MKTGHPSQRLLAAYALGRATEGAELAVSAHLTYCGACRAEVARMEALAGALVETEGAEEAPDLAAALARLDETEPEGAAPAPLRRGPLPAPVAEAIGVNFDEIPWRLRLPGVYEYSFRNEDGESVSLLRVRPGAAIPQHTHEAEELTVVFDGELVDGERRYGPGDVAFADPSVDHHPRAGGDRPCICLAVLSGGLTFTGRFGRALNLFS